MNDFLKHLNSRLDHLKTWLEEKEIEAYRWYDHGLVRYPFSVDVYLDYLHIHWSEHSENATETPEIIKQFFVNEFEFEPNKIFIKTRKQQKGKEQYNKLNASKHRFIVQENGRLFYINLADYFDSGLFLDHRDARALIGERSKGKKILNLFSYTGAFSVYAARGGATETVTVDTSNTYLDWARDNFKLNNIKQGKHDFLKQDAVTYLREMSRLKTQKFDVIVIDPPTFSNSKGRESTFEMKRDHPHLINNALALLNTDGFILFSTNFTKFKLKTELLYSKNIKEISKETCPLDFQNSPFLRFCYIINK